MKRLLATAAITIALIAGASANDVDAEAHGYATAAYEKVCGNDLVVTDAALRAKKDRLYRNNRMYAWGYRYVANQADAALAPNWFMIWKFCTLAEGAGWAEVPAERKQWLENKIKPRR